jgi:hypothetical protein
MFVKPRSARQNGGYRSSVGLFFVVVSAITFVRIIQGYIEHMTPIVTKEQSAELAIENASPVLYGSPCEPFFISTASGAVSKTIRRIVGEQIEDVRSNRSAPAVDLATPNCTTAPATAYTSSIATQFPQLLCKNHLAYLPAEVLDNGHIAIEQVVSFTKTQPQSECTYFLVSGRQGWHIGDVEPGNGSASGIEYRCLRLQQHEAKYRFRKSVNVD